MKLEPCPHHFSEELRRELGCRAGEGPIVPALIPSWVRDMAASVLLVALIIVGRIHSRGERASLEIILSTAANRHFPRARRNLGKSVGRGATAAPSCDNSASARVATISASRTKSLLSA